MSFDHIHNNPFIWCKPTKCAEIKAGLDSEAIRKKIESDANRQRHSAQDEAIASLQKKVEAENDRFIGDQRQQQKQVIRQQDQSLAVLDQGLTRLQSRAREINTEIKEQDHLLDDLKKDVDDANDRILTVNEALQRLLQTKDNCQIWTVVILAAILIILGTFIVVMFVRGTWISYGWSIRSGISDLDLSKYKLLDQEWLRSFPYDLHR